MFPRTSYARLPTMCSIQGPWNAHTTIDKFLPSFFFFLLDIRIFFPLLPPLLQLTLTVSSTKLLYRYFNIMRSIIKWEIVCGKNTNAVNAQIRGKIPKLVKTLKLKISSSPQTPLLRRTRLPSNCLAQLHCKHLSSFPFLFSTVFYRSCSKK